MGFESHLLDGTLMAEVSELDSPASLPSGIFSTMHHPSVVGPYAAIANIANSAGVWPAANRAIAVEFTVDTDILVTRMGWYNGATVAGSVDVGLYSSAWARLVSSGTTAMAGASAIQAVDVADTLLTAGNIYYKVMVSDSATATFFRATAIVQVLRASGVQQMASAFPLPATFTPANPSNSYLPVILASWKGTL